LEARIKENGTPVKAVALLSGGLDSTLAVKIILDMGIQVEAVNIHTGFCLIDHRRFISSRRGEAPPVNEALRAAADLGVHVEMIDISGEYLDVVLNPKHGYGSAANPCIDCRILMLKRAREYMDRIGADFLVTGEVLGQRPMTQHRGTMRRIAKESGTADMLLRPLSAKLLDPTKPEIEGLVDRERLYGISGRGRKDQMRLAREKGIAEYPQPAGGCCFLTDKNYARKFRDLVAHRPRGSITLDDLVILKAGRHFRVSESAKAIVGRDKAENEFLERFTTGRWIFKVLDYQGPLTLAEGEPSEGDLRAIASIAARYSDGKQEPELDVMCRHPDGREEKFTTPPMNESLVVQARL
jgi:tRNA U34 2-thiouridine synthase MnmA/TrmU